MDYRDAIALDWRDWQRLLDEVILERDELIQRLATEQIMNAELQHEAELAREERDDAIEVADSEKHFADLLKAERDQYRIDLVQARRYAEEMRDRFTPEKKFPWEAGK